MEDEADARLVAWGEKPGTAAELGVRFEMASRGSEPLILEKVATGAIVDHRAPPAAFEAVTMPVFDRFTATRTARYPAAWLLPAEATDVVALLRRQGIVVEKLAQPWHGQAEQFTVTEASVAQNAFQGHRLKRLEGRFEQTDADAPAGSYVVPGAQPLGRLAFLMLEPESLDGISAWGVLDGPLAPQVGAVYAIRKVYKPLAAATELVP